MGKMIKIGMAELSVCISPDTITTLGLGSCVGIALRDPVTKVGGMAHIMLPDSTQISRNSNLAKFADTGIKELIRVMVLKGANQSRIVAKIAGGAQMFSVQGKEDLIRIGEKNIEATKACLRANNIRILADDTGLNYGRTVIFYPETGEFIVRSVGKKDKSI